MAASREEIARFFGVVLPHLNEMQATSFADAGQPVISVDTKKKELVGDFSNKDREYQPAGEPVRVNVHDFVDKELGRAVPYGIYDLQRRGVGLGRRLGRHRNLRRRGHQAVVERDGTGPLSRGDATTRHRGRGRIERPSPPPTRILLRVRVPRCSRSSRKPRTSSFSALCFVASAPRRY